MRLILANNPRSEDPAKLLKTRKLRSCDCPFKETVFLFASLSSLRGQVLSGLVSGFSGHRTDGTAVAP